MDFIDCDIINTKVLALHIDKQKTTLKFTTDQGIFYFKPSAANPINKINKIKGLCNLLNAPIDIRVDARINRGQNKETFITSLYTKNGSFLVEYDSKMVGFNRTNMVLLKSSEIDTTELEFNKVFDF